VKKNINAYLTIPFNEVYIGGLTSTCEKEQLKEVFSDYGRVGPLYLSIIYVAKLFPGFKSVDSTEPSWVWVCADVRCWGCRRCCEGAAWH
jgi:RNA recognition motif-containing protein